MARSSGRSRPYEDRTVGLVAKMEPWGVKETRELMSKMSGSKSVELMAKLSDEGLLVLMDSIKTEKKNMSWKELKKRMDEVLWKVER